MLPSARPGMPAGSIPARGKEGNIGEGRRSGSRTSSEDSDEHGESSSDEDNEVGLSNPRGHSAGTSHDRPATGFQWGQSSKQSSSTFGLSTSTPQLSSGKANASSSTTAYPSSALILPSKVYGNPGSFSFASKPNTTYEHSAGPSSERPVLGAFSPVATAENPNSTSRHTESSQATSGASGSVDNSTQREAQSSSAIASSMSNVSVSSHDAPARREGDHATEQNLPDQLDQFLASLPAEGSTIGNAALLSTTSAASSSGTNTSMQDMPLSIHDFFYASVPITYQPSMTTQMSSLPEVVQNTGTTDVTLSSTHQREGSNSSAATIQTLRDKSASTTTEDGNSTQVKASSLKKRRLKKDGERKRGVWRVESYPTSSHHPREPEKPFSTLPGKPLFSTAGPVPLETTPLPHFEYKESRERPKRTPSAPLSQSDGTVKSAGTVSVSAIESRREQEALEDTYDYLDMDYQIDTDTDASILTEDYASPLQGGRLDDPRPLSSNSSFQSVGDFTGQSTAGQRVGDQSRLSQRGSTMSNASTVAVDELPAPCPESRLVSIVIEDTRVEDIEPSLAELELPLLPDWNGGFWLDAVDLCNVLQSGPSRIDGPAKVYTFRGTLRQYFLRVSAENVDNFARANLSVPAELVLRVTVESTVLSLSRSATEAWSQPRTTHSQGNIPHLASPAPSEGRLPLPTANVSSPNCHPSHALKRRREQPSLSNVASEKSAPSSTSVSQSGNSSAPTAPRPSYYRKRD